MKRLSIKTQLIIFLAVFAGYVCSKNNDVAFLGTLAVALACALCADAFLTFIKVKKWLFTESSAISGLLIGYVLSGDNPWWKIMAVSLAAIASKHLLRLKGKHLFNPAGFGIVMGIALLGASTQWQGTYLWYILIPAGLYFMYTIRKLEVLIGYGLVSIVVFGVQAVIQRVPLASIFGYFSYFYICIMLIEPKTSPLFRLGKLFFGASVGALIFIFTQMGVRIDAELLSLLIVNMSVPWLNKIIVKKEAAV